MVVAIEVEHAAVDEQAVRGSGGVDEQPVVPARETDGTAIEIGGGGVQLADIDVQRARPVLDYGPSAGDGAVQVQDRIRSGGPQEKNAGTRGDLAAGDPIIAGKSDDPARVVASRTKRECVRIRHVACDIHPAARFQSEGVDSGGGRQIAPAIGAKGDVRRGAQSQVGAQFGGGERAEPRATRRGGAGGSDVGGEGKTVSCGGIVRQNIRADRHGERTGEAAAAHKSRCRRIGDQLGDSRSDPTAQIGSPQQQRGARGNAPQSACVEGEGLGGVRSEGDGAASRGGCERAEGAGLQGEPRGADGGGAAECKRRGAGDGEDGGSRSNAGSGNDHAREQPRGAGDSDQRGGIGQAATGEGDVGAEGFDRGRKSVSDDGQ